MATKKCGLCKRKAQFLITFIDSGCFVTIRAGRKMSVLRCGEHSYTPPDARDGTVKKQKIK